MIILEYYEDKKKDENQGINEFKVNFDQMNETLYDYRVNDINLLSNDAGKVIELIKMNLNSMLKIGYLFMGVINSSKHSSRDYKMLFKKVNFLVKKDKFE